jgi:hypothetical protein
MFLKGVGTIARLSLLALPVAAITTAVSCGGSGNGGTAGTSGSTGGGGTGGMAGTDGGAISCTPVAPTSADVNILDWENVAVGATTSSFGDWMPGTYGGGTFEYPGPAADSGSPCDPAIHLCPNFDGKNWHITGMVHDYSGFGIYMNEKVKVWDVSMFTGLQFEISGTFTAPAGIDGGAPAAQVRFGVTDARHEVDSAHTRDARVTCGTCAPGNGDEYDGTCEAPSKVIMLTATPTPVVLRWSDISGGRRPPSFTGESPDPAQVTHITWVPPWNEAGASPYMVDITIDNLKYTTQ